MELPAPTLVQQAGIPLFGYLTSATALIIISRRQVGTTFLRVRPWQSVDPIQNEWMEGWNEWMGANGWMDGWMSTTQ